MIETPLFWIEDYTDEQIEAAVQRLNSRLEHQRGEYLMNQLAQAELVRVLSNRKVQAVVKSALEEDEENNL